MSDSVTWLRLQAEDDRMDGMPETAKRHEAAAAEVERLQDEVLQTGDRLDLAERVVAACVIVDQIQPMPLAIMEPVHRWQEYRAAEAAKEE